MHASYQLTSPILRLPLASGTTAVVLEESYPGAAEHALRRSPLSTYTRTRTHLPSFPPPTSNLRLPSAARVHVVCTYAGEWFDIGTSELASLRETNLDSVGSVWALQEINSEDGANSDGGGSGGSGGADGGGTTDFTPQPGGVRNEATATDEPSGAVEHGATAVAESGVNRDFSERLDELGLRDTAWSYVGDGGEEHGPFGAEEIVTWWADGHFEGTLRVRLVSPRAHGEPAHGEPRGSVEGRGSLVWVELAQSQLAKVLA